VSDDEVRQDEDPQRWFSEHYDGAAGQVLDFLPEGGLEGKIAGDVGSGDGIIDLALTIRGRPAKFVGFDVRPTNVDALLRSAQAAGVAEVLPDELSFTASRIDGLPAPDDFFDVLVSWSVFEHVSEPVRMFAEIARVLKPGGMLFLQLWPFYYSEHGGHLWPHYDESFPHLLYSNEAVEDHIAGRRATDPAREALDEFHSLNRVTVDQLQRAMLAAGLRTAKLELLAQAVYIPPELSHLPLSEVGISGAKLLAVTPDRGDAEEPGRTTDD
jgi:ubiquinone/menaquinone biosynthesis C-methylase UbiE